MRRYSKHAVWLIAIICFLQTIHAQTASTILTNAPNAAATYFDTKALNRIDSLIQDYVDQKFIGGATALIAVDGKIVYHKGIGYHNPATKAPMPKDEIFRIASQTKAITSAAVMMLYEQGKFMLDDPISRFIPAFKNPAVLDSFIEKDSSYTTKPAKREITIRDLLMHTSGIGYGQIGSKTFNAISSKNDVTSGIGLSTRLLGTEINKLAKLPLAHHPGEKFTYGLNTDVLGYLIEVTSGETLDQFFRKHIFEPLGMKDTYFYLPANKQNRLTVLNGEDDQKLIKAKDKTFELNGPWITDYPKTAGTYFSGGGGLSSTAYDYSLFMQMLLNGGTYNGHRLLSPNSIHLMTMDQTKLAGITERHFGLGFGILTEADEAKLGVSTGSYEWGGMFSSTYWIDPKRHMVAQLFINQLPMSHGDIHQKFKALVYSAFKN